MTDDAVCQISHTNIDLALTCSICFGTYKTPKHLPCCSHSFCLPCLENLVKLDTSCWNVICCPQCRTKSPLPFGGVRYFQTNIALQQIVEAWLNQPSSKFNNKVQPLQNCENEPLKSAQHDRRVNADSFLSAAIQGDVTTVCRLLRKCGRVLFSERYNDDVGSTGLHLAVRHGHIHLVRTMLKMDAWIGTPDNKDNTALHYAARYGQEDIANLLMKSGFEVDVLGELARTPLLTASANGHAVIVRNLLANGANLFAVDMYGASAALLACWAGSIAVLHELTLFGSDFTSADKNGNFPLYVAAAKGNVEGVAMLLNTEAGFLIDQRGENDQTALHAAASFGNVEVAKLLILHRAFMLRDHSGLTPLELARQRGHHEFAKVIAEFASNNGYLLDEEASLSFSKPDEFRLKFGFDNDNCWFHSSAAVP